MNRSLRLLWVVWLKELRDALRDRRSVMSALLFPLIAPAMTYVMLTSVTEVAREARATELPVINAELAPPLVEFLERYQITVVEAPDDPVAAVRNGDVDLVLRIDDDFVDQFTAGVPAKLEIITDGSQQRAAAKAARLRSLLNGYAQYVTDFRLSARGLNPALARPLEIRELETASGEQLAGRVLSMLPMFLIMAAFFCGMQVAVDATAGERERGSLEPLLLTGTPRWAITGGKWLAASMFGCAGVLLTLVLVAFALGRIPLHEFGMQSRLGPAELGAIAALVLPLAFCGAGLQLLLATFARSFKEAQIYVSLFAMLPTVPGVYSIIEPIRDPGALLGIPGLAQQLLVMDTMTGQPVAVGMVALVGGIALLLGAVGAWVTAWLFGHERIVYAR